MFKNKWYVIKEKKKIFPRKNVILAGISYTLYGSGLRQVTMERALIICLVEPILNPIWVYLGNGEVPSMTTVIGVSFILLGAITDILFTSRAKKTEQN